MATGEACGTLAALASSSGRSLRDVPYSELSAQLLRQGAMLELS
jgi:hypothetical protein